MVSIIVPVYNGKRYLERCLESLLRQTYSNIEVIVVDDGSTDASDNIYNRYRNRDNFHILFQKNAGVSAARNVGLKRAKGKYVIFCDCDDYVSDQFVDILVQGVEKYNTELSCCGWIEHEVSENASFLMNASKVNIVSGGEMFRNILLDAYCSGYVWNKLFIRDIIERGSALRFHTDLAILEDQVFVLEYLKRIHTMSISTEKLYAYSQNEAGALKQKLNEKKLSTLIGRERTLSLVEEGCNDDSVKTIAWNQLMRCYVLMFKNLYKHNYQNRKKWLSLITRGYKKQKGRYAFDQSWGIRTKIYRLILALYCGFWSV